MKLLCAISHHGLGHLAQAAPVLNAMGEMRPDLEWLVWSALPRSILEGRLKIPFHHRQDLADVGLLMHDAMRVDVAASRMAYLAFHQHWHTRVAREADWLKRENVDGVLSNAAYLPLAAASHAGKASVGFCSLNWWDIAHAYLHDAPDMQPVFIEMRQAYLGAQAFLRLTPGLPMAWLSNLEVAPPVASLGRNRRKHLNQRLGLAPDQKWVLLGFGGVTYQHTAPLPALPHITWLAPDGWQKEDRADLVHFTQAGLPFPDLLASCDALVTKVGYGSFVESAGLGLPVLFLDRPDWPETPWLASWLAQHTRAAAISEEMLFSPDIGAALTRLWQAPVPKAPDVSGAAAIGRRILNYLGG